MIGIHRWKPGALGQVREKRLCLQQFKGGMEYVEQSRVMGTPFHEWAHVLYFLINGKSSREAEMTLKHVPIIIEEEESS